MGLVYKKEATKNIASHVENTLATGTFYTEIGRFQPTSTRNQSGNTVAFCLGKSTQMVVAPPAA